MRPDSGRVNGCEVSLCRPGPGVCVDLCLEGGFQGFVRIVGAEEVGVAHEEALFVLVHVDKPAGDALGAVTFDSAHIDKAGSKRVNDTKVHWIRPLPKSRFGFLSRYRVLHRSLAHGWRQAANNPRADHIVPAWGVSSTSQ